MHGDRHEPSAQPVTLPPRQLHNSQPYQTGYFPEPMPDRSPEAIFTLLFSIIGFLSLLPFIGGPVPMFYFAGFWIIAFILGIITLVTIKKKGYKKGKGYAITGIVIGVIVFVLAPWYIFESMAMEHSGLIDTPYAIFSVTNSTDTLETNVTNDEVAVITLIEGGVFTHELEILISADEDV